MKLGTATAEITRESRIRELTKLPEFTLALKHAKLGIYTSIAGFGTLLLFVFLHEIRPLLVPEFGWSALLSIPVTLLCIGLFSVFYEWYIRTTFTNSMRSLYWAWDTGVTVFPTHQHAPDRKEVLNRARNQVSLMSTTFSRYFTDVREIVDQKARQGVRFRFIIYHHELERCER